VNVSLARQVAGIINEKVEAGMYHPSRQVIRGALRLLGSREQIRQTKLEELPREIQKGITGGFSISGEEVSQELQ
jgi:putative addiction module CopG family antidote